MMVISDAVRVDRLNSGAGGASAVVVSFGEVEESFGGVKVAQELQREFSVSMRPQANDSDLRAGWSRSVV